jgi:hypothetical protein
MIGAFCSTSDSPDHKSACSLGAEAAAYQTGIYADLDTWERIQTQNAERIAKNLVRDKDKEKYIVTMMLINTASGKTTNFKLGRGPLDGNYELETGLSNFKLGVRWEF